MPKISVLMPVFNAEPYLKQCMDSVLNQTLTDIEILCINDGSKDSSGTILDEYAARDNRIKVIHKENTGYGHSLNHAISEAKGEYIGIVEPDDYVRYDMFEILYRCATENESGEHLDFAKGNYYTFTTNGDSETQEPFSKRFLANKVITPREHLITFHGAPTIWAAIYKKDFLTNKKVQFLETPGASFQDTGFYIRSNFEADKAIFIQDPLYYYRVDNLASSVKDKSKIFAIVDEFKALENRYSNKDDKRKIINSLKLEKYIWNFQRLNDDGRQEFEDEYKKLIHIIKNHDYHLEIIGTTALKYACRTLNINYPWTVRIESILINMRRAIKKIINK